MGNPTTKTPTRPSIFVGSPATETHPPGWPSVVRGGSLESIAAARKEWALAAPIENVKALAESAIESLKLLNRRGTQDRWSVCREGALGTLGTPCVQAYDDEALVAGPGGDWGEGAHPADDIVLVAGARNALPALLTLAQAVLDNHEAGLRLALLELYDLEDSLQRLVSDAEAVHEAAAQTKGGR